MLRFNRRQTIVPPRLSVPPIPDTDLVPSQPPGLRPTGGQPVNLPGADFPPAGAIAVDQLGDQDLAPSATGILVTIAVPPMLRFRMAGIGFGADDEVALGFLTWAILLDGDPAASGYSAQSASIGSLQQLADIFLLVGSTQVVTIRATIDSTAGVTFRYICRVRGWFYSEKEGS